MAMLDDLGAFVDDLAALHLGGFRSDGADAAIAILETAGLTPVRGMATGPGVGGIACEWAGAQVLVRDRDYVAARALAVRALNALDNAGPFVTLDGVRYDHVTALQRPPFFVGPDQNDRKIFSFNLLVAKGATT